MLTALLVAMLSVAASAMTFTQAQQEALFLSDKMAYELRLTEDQFEAVYEINLDYFLSIRYEDDVFGIYWNRRNTDLRFVLTTWQYRRYISTADFYQPARWQRNGWSFSIYARYDRATHFRQPPTPYSSYRGGRNRGTISFYENRPISKPSEPRPGSGPGWTLHPQPGGGGQPGNTHFSQPNGGGATQPGGYQPGTNNRSNNTNTGTRRFGTGTSQPTSQPANNGNKPAGTAQPAAGNKPSGASSTSRPSGQQNGSGNFGGRR